MIHFDAAPAAPQHPTGNDRRFRGNHVQSLTGSATRYLFGDMQLCASERARRVTRGVPDVARFINYWAGALFLVGWGFVRGDDGHNANPPQRVIDGKVVDSAGAPVAVPASCSGPTMT